MKDRKEERKEKRRNDPNTRKDMASIAEQNKAEHRREEDGKSKTGRNGKKTIG